MKKKVVFVEGTLGTLRDCHACPYWGNSWDSGSRRECKNPRFAYYGRHMDPDDYCNDEQ